MSARRRATAAVVGHAAERTTAVTVDADGQDGTDIGDRAVQAAVAAAPASDQCAYLWDARAGLPPILQTLMGAWSELVTCVPPEQPAPVVGAEAGAGDPSATAAARCRETRAVRAAARTAGCAPASREEWFTRIAGLEALACAIAGPAMIAQLAREAEQCPPYPSAVWRAVRGGGDDGYGPWREWSWPRARSLRGTP